MISCVRRGILNVRFLAINFHKRYLSSYIIDAAGAFSFINKELARSAAPIAAVHLSFFPEKRRVLLAGYPLSWGKAPTVLGRVVLSQLLL
jgi:hypothetical protein